MSESERYPEFMKNPRSWAAMIELYRDDVENWGGSPEMLRLVECLTGQNYRNLFTPGTSLMRLLIRLEAYPQQPVDSLVVWWDGGIKAYQIDYYEAGHSRPEKRSCTWPLVVDVIEAKLLRMWLVGYRGAA